MMEQQVNYPCETLIAFHRLTDTTAQGSTEYTTYRAQIDYLAKKPGRTPEGLE